MQLETQPLQLKLSTPFRIARGVEEIADNLLVTLSHDGLSGYGEAAPSAYYGETATTVSACLERFARELGDDPFLIADILERLDHVIGRNPAAKAAIDMALYDLVGKLLNLPLYRLLGLNPARSALTSFTIGLDTPEHMAEKAARAQDYPILKIKVGTRHDVENVRAIRAVSQATLRVDANAGWSVKEAIRTINALAEYGIEFVEQPIAPGDLEGLRLLRQQIPVPIIVDESCVSLEDIPRLAGCVDGINIKLMKCGGISHALKMIHTARAHHLQVMLGCMIESSLAITAAAHLTPLVDYADLDGNLLIDNDPFCGVRVIQGKLILPERPGLGVVPRVHTGGENDKQGVV
ncbi:dipeptide epimerase [Thermogemmatispora sp.]|uniref:dipeptide epimerase n=1 Tax=Thermogemmatispora sp. TaxID=1968838 RepID=UPI001DCA8C29|nr:dipeptide epimerase [Thermogemmatispora sp.]MBX5448617.1 dipeptide epimerase [Thermogemmatispora sp.]